MRLYARIARQGFRRYATYRAATAAGVFTNTVFGFLQAFVLLAVYRSRAEVGGFEVGGFDVAEALTYVFVTQGLLAPVDAFDAGTAEINDRIRTGDIVTDLYRPVDLQGYWLALNLGRAAFQALARGIPPFVVGALALDLVVPADLTTWVAFAASVMVAVVASFGLRFAVSLSGFWLLDARGAAQLMTAVTLFFSGFVLPITFLPGLARDAQPGAAVRRAGPGPCRGLPRQGGPRTGAAGAGGVGARPAGPRPGGARGRHPQGGRPGWLS